MAPPVGLTARRGRPLSPDRGRPPGARDVEPAPAGAPVPGTAGPRTGPVGRTGHRAAGALAACGALCVLLGAAMLAPGPAPQVAVIGNPAPTGTEPRPGTAVWSIARLLAADVPPPPPRPVPAGTPPVELLLPAHDVRAPVVAVTTGPEGALLVPDPPSTVGWWSPSALAGGPSGTTVLAGHVDSATAGLGALAVLRHVDAGEEVELRGADGREIGYRVTARRQYAKAELPPEVFAAGGPPRLVLITCGGAFDRKTRHYTDNVVVVAEPT